MSATTPTHAHDLLQRAAAGDVIRLPADLAQRLLSAASAADIELLLGLASPHRRARRDAALRRAAGLLTEADASIRHRAAVLAAALCRFESVVWPRVLKGQPVDTLGPADQALAVAFTEAGGGCMPHSESHLATLFCA